MAQVDVTSGRWRCGGASWWWRTSVGAQLLGCNATLWMHHPLVAQVGGGASGGGAKWWRKFDASWFGGASLAQVAALIW